MLLLTSTSDKIQVVTGSAVVMEVHASWVDNASGTITPGRTNTEITTATTTDVVASPGASTQRNVQTLVVRNNDASSSNDVTVRHTDGTTAVDIFKATLAFGEALQFIDGVGFQVLANSGAVKTSQNQGNNATSSSLSTVVLGADRTNNNAVANTIADVTGLSFAVTSGSTYWFRFVIMYTAPATSTGSRWSISGPTTTLQGWRTSNTVVAAGTVGTDSFTEGSIIAYDSPAASNATSATATAGTVNVVTMEGFITPSADGTVIARFASEVSNSAIIAKAGSCVFYQQVI
jgi:hypothetical protein